MAPANSASSGVVFRLMTSAARWMRSIRGHYRAAGRRPVATAVRHALRGRGHGRARCDRPGHLDPHQASVAAIAPVLVLAVASEVAGSIPQFGAVHRDLPTHWWMSLDTLFRLPFATSDLLPGLPSAGGVRGELLTDHVYAR